MKRLTALFIMTIFLTLVPTVLAQTPNRSRSNASTSATPTRTENPRVRPSTPAANVRDRVATQVAEVKNKNRYIVGTINEISGTTLMVTVRNTVVEVKTDTTTKIFDLQNGRRQIAFGALRVKDKIGAVGIANGDTTGTATLIARIPAETNRPQTIVGTINQVIVATPSASTTRTTTATASATITITQKTGTSSAVLITKDTKILGSVTPAPKPENLKTGQKVVVVARNISGTLTATHLIVIGESRLTPTPRREATRSAATNSARPSTSSARPTTTRTVSPTTTLTPTP